MSYAEFLLQKRIKAGDAGFDADALSTELFGFQRQIVRWALKKGRSAIFADTGLGKTAMQLEWARHVYERPAVKFDLRPAGGWRPDRVERARSSAFLRGCVAMLRTSDRGST